MNYAIIVAAGKGKRMNSKLNKILLLLDDKPIIYHSIRPFEESPLIDRILLISNKDSIADLKSVIRENRFDKTEIFEGGEERQDSVYRGIMSIKDAKEDDIVLVHNGVNPFISTKIIEDMISSAKEHGACAAAFKVKDTIKEVDEDNFIIKTLDRDRLWHMQTPQAAKYRLIAKAFIHAYNSSHYGTDDTSLIEKLGEKVKVIGCSRENFKITSPIDLEGAKMVISADRVGIGLDSHRFTEEPKQLILGSVAIPDEKGLEANSDGDVILHSLFNALSQAIGRKSLGFYADPLCKKGVKDSSSYLNIALDMVKEKGFKINNIGIMIEAKRPRLDDHEELIKEKVAGLCSISSSQIGLTATSGEGLTAFGRGEGIQVFTIVSLRKIGKGEED